MLNNKGKKKLTYFIALGCLFAGGQSSADSVVLNAQNQLIIPSVSVGNTAYAVALDLVSTSPMRFQLNQAPYGEVKSNALSASFSNNELIIHQVLVNSDLFSAKLNLVNASPLSFELSSASQICSDCAAAKGIADRPSLLSPDVINQGNIDNLYTCNGSNFAPALTWTPGPQGTKSYAIIMDDPDAKSIAGFTWVHMNIYNLPANQNSLPRGVIPSSLPLGASFGPNDDNTTEYSGPCPPNGTHKYIWKLYALNTKLDVPSTPKTRAEFEALYAANIISESTVLEASYGQ